MSSPFSQTVLFVGIAALAASACSGEAQPAVAIISDGGAGGSLNSASDGSGGNSSDGSGGNSFSTGSTTGAGGSDVCAQQEATATTINRPIDIIFVIDNSGSMGGEIEDVEFQINQNFANIIENANPPIDYRVIMVSEFGKTQHKAICVSEPLGGIDDKDPVDGHCDSHPVDGFPTEPVNTGKFFHHAPDRPDPGVNSHNALCRLGEQFSEGDKFGLQPNGYQDVLREEAFKLFVVISDDGADDRSNNACSFGVYDDGDTVSDGQVVANAWDSDILNLSPQHFGTTAARNYKFHSIVALAPYNETANAPYGEPHPPSAPILTEKCGNAQVAHGPGTGYQALSVKTGGARYPTCSPEFTDIFTLMAQGVIEGAAIACEYEIPEAPVGETLDLDTVVVEYTSGDTTVSLARVADPANCDASSFYIEDDLIKLCADACAVTQADEQAAVKIKFGCELDPD